MRWLLVVAVVMLGCAAPKKQIRHVYVPKSSGPCWRECKAMSIECLKKEVAPLYVYEHNEYCEDERLNCLLTCDGARETVAETTDGL